MIKAVCVTRFWLCLHCNSYRINLPHRLLFLFYRCLVICTIRKKKRNDVAIYVSIFVCLRNVKNRMYRRVYIIYTSSFCSLSLYTYMYLRHIFIGEKRGACFPVIRESLPANVSLFLTKLSIVLKLPFSSSSYFFHVIPTSPSTGLTITSFT